MKKIVKVGIFISKAIISLIILSILLTIFINIHVKSSTEDMIISAEESLDKDADCILVLGAGVRRDGSPSPMLEDRILTGMDLYNKGVSDRLIMSGDHSTKGYDEVNTMKRYAVERGIPSEHVFMDHAGISTYDSIYRAKEIFQADKIIIVTQQYHLYRALYTARSLGIEAYGVSADIRVYAGQDLREIREKAARVKDFFMAIFKPNPKFLGDTIPVSGNGDTTNDN
ncbi:SanA/YdcF family protein [Sedimentibacter saalensis]|uniref:Vancomycin permeability regulator SanA n=1 Tax=Sedimentibacter saalensis TaxID=130788 RepID=A0A562JCC4_9FIRM|nr:ElyC/SanA/YdcF family protein [Sedimentibacter saalensis]TWH80454.1 vancomycin permeability regulator SanA [Sedimentibacter saalensis]